MVESISRRNLVLSFAAACALLAPVTGRAAGASPTASDSAPIVLAAPKDFSSAVRIVEQVTGAKGEKLRIGDVPLEQGRSFAVAPRVAQRLLDGSHDAFKRAGLFLFRYERSFGLPGEKDHVALLHTADGSAVIRSVGTAGARGAPSSDAIVAWLEALAKEEPFELSEIGADYVAGRFARAPKDPMAVAKRCAEFAPDLVAGRASTLELLAHEIAAERTLYLIW